MLERLVLKSPIQRTSKRVKWTSGARDDIFFPGDDGEAGHFFPNLEILAEPDGGRGTFWLEMISSLLMSNAGAMGFGGPRGPSTVRDAPGWSLRQGAIVQRHGYKFTF